MSKLIEMIRYLDSEMASLTTDQLLVQICARLDRFFPDAQFQLEQIALVDRASALIRSQIEQATAAGFFELAASLGQLLNDNPEQGGGL